MEDKQYVQVITYSLLAVIIIIINLFSLVVLFWSKKLLSKPQVILLINLIANHLIQGSVVMPIYALRKSKNYPVAMYPGVCDTWRLSYMLTFYGTCVNVLLIALDRFVATKYFVKYSGHFKYRHFLTAVCVGWFYVVVLCLIPFIPLQKSVSLKKPFYCNYNQPPEWTVFMLMFNTVLPYFAVMLIYIYITRQLGASSPFPKVVYNKNTKNNNNDKTIGRMNMRTDSKDSSCSIITVAERWVKKSRKKSVQYKKVNKLTFRIIFIYGITWTPSIVYYSIVTITPGIFSDAFYVSFEETVITFVIKYITFFNAAAAPVLYCYNHGEFRKEAKRFFRLMLKMDGGGMLCCFNKVKKSYHLR